MPRERTRTRRTVNLDDGLHRRARAVLARLPGTPSLSSLVNDLLAGMVPVLEDVAEVYETQGSDAAEEVIHRSVGRALMGSLTSQQSEEAVET